jgi:hypothetical protein
VAAAGKLAHQPALTIIDVGVRYSFEIQLAAPGLFIGRIDTEVDKRELLARRNWSAFPRNWGGPTSTATTAIPGSFSCI